MSVVKKAVIPAGGLGTKFLPATKSVPKELLPIVDIPAIQYIVKEAAESGITEIVIVTSRGKNAVLDYFDAYPELEAKLEREGKHDLLLRLREVSNLCNIVFVRQSEPLGLGHAVLSAKAVIGNEPFAVLLSDDLVDSAVPCTRQVLDAFEKHQKSVVALLRVPDEEISQFGICGGKCLGDREYLLDTIVEKPTLQDAPSSLSIVGRYVFKPEIFAYLEQTKPGPSGEIELTDAMVQMMKADGFIGYEFSGKRYDVGEKLGFIQAAIAYGLKRREIAPMLLEHIRKVLESG